jgi:hypothetical protein
MPDYRTLDETTLIRSELDILPNQLGEGRARERP